MEGPKIKKIVGVPSLEDPLLGLAKERAKDLVERAQLNEAVRVVDELLAEVATMKIAKRHSLEKGAYIEGTHEASSLAPQFRGLTGNEHKRKQLEMALRQVRDRIGSSAADLEIIVLDIESSKME